jgi:hypothetical protein
MIIKKKQRLLILKYQSYARLAPIGKTPEFHYENTI